MGINTLSFAFILDGVRSNELYKWEGKKINLEKSTLICNRSNYHYSNRVPVHQFQSRKWLEYKFSQGDAFFVYLASYVIFSFEKEFYSNIDWFVTVYSYISILKGHF